jgi:arylsulfatase A-like enzyme
MRPNVLLVVMDTARADAFEPYGASAGATPAVAQLASRGVAPGDVFATGSWTLPSHASMLSGLMPRAIGLTQPPGGTPQGARPVLEASRERLLPEVLRADGYETVGMTANLWVSPHAGFDTGFERFEYVHAQRQVRMETPEGGDLRARASWALEGLRARADDGAAEVEARLVELVSRRSEQPFFCLVNLIEAHSPYLPPRPYNDLPARGRVRAAIEARRHLSFEGICRACLGEFDIPDEALGRMRHLYTRSVRFLDDWLARVLEALDGSGALDDTLVIVTSDHGENLGDGGLIGHAFSLDNRLIRVPLVAAGPGADGFDEQPVTSLGSLPRMVAGAVGLERHPWEADALPAGVAVAQFDSPGPSSHPRVAHFIEQWDVDRAEYWRLDEPLAAATDARWKLERRGERELLFDLEADPLELDGREPDGSAAVERLREALRHPAVTAAAPADADAGPADPEEIGELEAQMKLLGYM